MRQTPYMPIRNKRAHLAALLRTIGALAALEHFTRRPSLVVLAYHRIADPSSDPFYTPLISATPAQFRNHLLQLEPRYQFLSLEQLSQAIDSRGRLQLSKPSALITFDDGYHDNLTNALPILRELRIPAAFFLTTGFLDRDVLPWWDRVAYVLKTTRRAVLELDLPAPMRFDFATTSRETSIAQVVGAFIRSGWQAGPEALAHLHERAEVPADTVDRAAHDLFLSWNEVQALAEAGMSIGAHTHTHRRLAGLDPAEQSRELADPRRQIEQAIGRPVQALAYPFGGTGAADATTRRIARESGYTLAFSLEPAVLHPGPVDPLDIPRFNILAADTPTQIRARLCLARALGRPIV